MRRRTGTEAAQAATWKELIELLRRVDWAFSD
jgi:hypothetical protein